MKILTLDLNKLNRDQLQAYLMLEQVSEQHKIQDDNKGWMDSEPDPEPDEPELPPAFEEQEQDDGQDFIA